MISIFGCGTKPPDTICWVDAKAISNRKVAIPAILVPSAGRYLLDFLLTIGEIAITPVARATWG
ncbi:hypothetical protein [Mycobacterium riyadhense]|uniref:Uncharacterized protein n=1 Tax=Mycobacterium riyadhense TaxID=486698 RepID=A0A653F2T6_9MYCO|nr:hypothetical protein [Mycobacterium riyadhense]VTP04064.1 hypothetical protein BIN_B_05373 [Mycobacterium riyadhense]